jgi:hypothetical protein
MWWGDTLWYIVMTRQYIVGWHTTVCSGVTHNSMVLRWHIIVWNGMAHNSTWGGTKRYVVGWHIMVHSEVTLGSVEWGWHMVCSGVTHDSVLCGWQFETLRTLAAWHQIIYNTSSPLDWAISVISSDFGYGPMVGCGVNYTYCPRIEVSSARNCVNMRTESVIGH